ncbi:hydroxyacylglutathione hydrolase [Pseudomonas sp. Pseusp97]|uniref:hydroxyacylglutathione hydrolase n=1 Tax=Pseudomonas sp. Pseusp97 TaxID=3243065 RepID=UPI0039A49F20
MIQIDALPAFSDNYLWLLQDAARRECAVVDPGDAAPVEQWLQAHPGWKLTDILVTHHHADHVGGVARLKAETGARVLGPAGEKIPGRDVALEDGDRVEVLGLEFQVIHVPGHTLGHIAYFHSTDSNEDEKQPLLFCGDTLFAAGCGRLFEGTPAQMHASLSRLAALPGQTAVYCAHEYTLSNLRFACAVEPKNPEVLARFEEVSRWREQGRISLPSSIALERATNPFLRVSEISVKKIADERNGQQIRTPEEVFATIRSWKDQF